MATRAGVLPTEDWLAKLDRIERSVAQIRTPAGFASDAYTLREHIAGTARGNGTDRFVSILKIAG